MDKTLVSKNRTRNLLFSALMIGTVVSALLQTALTTALPKIITDFSISAQTGQWLTSAFSLAMGIMIPATTFLIKRIPTKWLFIGSMTLFGIGELLSATATTFIILLIGRILQALGSGILLSLTQVVVLTIYPLKKQGTMMGIYGLAASAAPVVAPTVTGLIIDTFSWRFIFWAGLLLTVVDILFAFLAVKNVLPTEKTTLDVKSLLLSSISFSGILVGFGNIGSGPLLSIQIGLPIIIGLLSGCLFAYRQFHISEPLLNLKIFKNKQFTIAVIISILLYFAMMSGSTLFPLYIQSVHQLSATTSGLIMLPASLVMAILSPITGRLYDKLGIRPLAILGSFAMLISCLTTIHLNVQTSILYLVLVWIIRLVSISCVMMPIVTWSVSTLDTKFTSHATALLTTLRTISGAIGTAVSVSIMQFVTNLTTHNGPVIANSSGINVTFIVLAVIAAIQLIVSLLWVKKN